MQICSMTPWEKERQAQIKHAREVLQLNKKPTQEKTMNENRHHNAKPKNQVNGAPKKKTSDRQLTGHEKELSRAITEKTPTLVYFVGSEQPVSVQILDFDKYAVKLQPQHAKHPMWVFKHTIAKMSFVFQEEARSNV